jgi:hypothetical protein
MKTLLVLAATLAAAGAKKKEPPPPADPMAAVAKAHAGKVWVSGGSFPSSEGAKLAAWLGQHPAAGEVAAKAKDAPWTVNYLAVFKKPALKGAMTVQFFEKSDLKNFVDQYSPQSTVATLVFQGTYDLSPDQGFNKGRTYVLKVGQIIANKFVPYATGQVTLK